MKRKDLEKLLCNAGWSKTEGGKHSKWKRGNRTLVVPGHREINELLARAILKQAGLD